MVSWGKKLKLGVREKNEKGERENEENYIKQGEKALKCIFLGYKLKKKIEGGGDDQNAQYISLLYSLCPDHDSIERACI